MIQEGKLKKKCCLILAALFCMSFFLQAGTMVVNAETEKKGTVTGITTTLNFRSGPGTEYSVIGSLKNGQAGNVLGEAYATNGKLWYKMYISGMTGWVSSDYIKVSEYAVTVDEEFEVYLRKQGFPESYRSQLQALHQKYPNWIFEAQITNLDWKEVIEEESALGKNLVSTNSISSWKSTQTGAYDWETGTWKIFDSGGWVMASSKLIAYCMDPRNFLDSTNIFQFIKQSYDASSLTSDQLSRKKTDLTSMVKGTYLSGKCDGNSYVDVIMNVAEQTGVCPFTLASMMIQEQGVNGTGSSISGTVAGYKGYYNYFNIGAYATSTMTAVERGLWYASGSGEGATSYGRPWNTRVKSIKGGALYYGSNYVNVGQDTMYLKKFNVQGTNIYNHQYMTNVQGAISEGQHIADAYDANARKAALVFKIPVYKNMPQEACGKPTGNDNPNYMLKSLNVSNYTLTPEFSMYETAYSLKVENNVSSVTISASALANTTTVSGTGKKNLNIGTNTFKIVTKAENGDSKTYIINIYREESSSKTEQNTEIKDSVLKSPYYKINEDNTVSGITDYPISVSEFQKKVSVSNGSIKITTATGTVKSGNIGTGTQIRVYDEAENLKNIYRIVIYGDVNGDGAINAQDLLLIQKNNIKINLLTEEYAIAADANRDERVNAQDLLLVQKNNIKVTTILQ